MSSLPYFPFYPQAWLDDTRIFDMGLEAEGAYIRLLALMWVRGGSIPDNERWICNALRCTKAKWKGLRGVLIEGESAVFYLENGAIFNPRLCEELAKADQKSIKSRSNIEQRWKKTNDFGGEKVNKINETMDTPVLPPLYHRDIDRDKDRDKDKKEEKEKEEKRSRSSLVITRPEGVSDEVWADFQALRKAKKSPVTQTAINGIARETIKAGVSLQDALEMCCQRGWVGFKAEWLSDFKHQTNQQKGVGDDRRQQQKQRRGRDTLDSATLEHYAQIPGFE